MLHGNTSPIVESPVVAMRLSSDGPRFRAVFPFSSPSGPDIAQSGQVVVCLSGAKPGYQCGTVGQPKTFTAMRATRPRPPREPNSRSGLGSTTTITDTLFQPLPGVERSSPA